MVSRYWLENGMEFMRQAEIRDADRGNASLCGVDENHQNGRTLIWSADRTV